jgi:hypothetical protein
MKTTRKFYLKFQALGTFFCALSIVCLGEYFSNDNGQERLQLSSTNNSKTFSCNDDDDDCFCDNLILRCPPRTSWAWAGDLPAFPTNASLTEIFSFSTVPIHSLIPYYYSGLSPPLATYSLYLS